MYFDEIKGEATTFGPIVQLYLIFIHSPSHFDRSPRGLRAPPLLVSDLPRRSGNLEITMPINKRVQFMRLRKNGRAPSNYPVDGCGVPMRITRMFPMKLKDVTLDKLHEQRAVSDVACINEMMTLFDCFEKSDYNSVACQQQANLLEQCYTAHMAKKSEFKMKQRLEREKNK